jgi:hypothetical protein
MQITAGPAYVAAARNKCGVILASHERAYKLRQAPTLMEKKALDASDGFGMGLARGAGRRMSWSDNEPSFLLELQASGGTCFMSSCIPVDFNCVYPDGWYIYGWID